MASAFDPSAFLAAEAAAREQTLAGGAILSAPEQEAWKPAEKRESLTPAEPALAAIAGIARGAGDLPWSSDLARLLASPSPDGVNEDWWGKLVAAIARLDREWGRQALDCGWSSVDLFGCNPVPFPFARRLDRDGLAMRLIDGLTVIALDRDGATLKERRATLRFRRRPLPGAVHLWEAYLLGHGP